MFLFLLHTFYRVTYLWAMICLHLSWSQTVPGWDPCWWGGWTGLIGAEGASGSAIDTLNITCSIDTTSGLLFSLCNWADNVPWFPLFCTSICSAWAAQCILVSWKWSRVSERSGYPPSMFQFCRWADGIAAAAEQRPQRTEFIHCPGCWGLCSLTGAIIIAKLGQKNVLSLWFNSFIL